MSEFHVEVVRLGPVQPLPNSDALDITNVHGGYPCIIRRGQFKEGDLAVYIPVDAVVPTSRPEFTFLQDSKGSPTYRIRAKKLRGTFSMGLLIPMPSDEEFMQAGVTYAVGANVQELLGITKYETDESNIRAGASGISYSSGSSIEDPSFFPVYTDLDSVRRYGHLLEEGEEVIITEKVDGSSARYLYHQDQFWIGSHYKTKLHPREVTAQELMSWRVQLCLWTIITFAWNLMPRFMQRLVSRMTSWSLPRAPRRPTGVKSNVWWEAATTYGLEKRCSTIPGILIYGEVFGTTQKLKYDSKGRTLFRAFDALDIKTRKFLDYDEFLGLMLLLNIPVCPVLYRGPWSEECKKLADGETTIGDEKHIREGFVVRPARERVTTLGKRVILKCVGEQYLLQK